MPTSAAHPSVTQAISVHAQSAAAHSTTCAHTAQSRTLRTRTCLGRPVSPFRGFKRSLLTDLKERPSRPPWRELRPECAPEARPPATSLQIDGTNGVCKVRPRFLSSISLAAAPSPLRAARLPFCQLALSGNGL